MPPILTNRYEYKQCTQINSSTGRTYITPDGDAVPSVTTILSKTGNKQHLIDWKKRIGENKAATITREAAGVGTALHGNLERYIRGEQRQPGNNYVHIVANRMADEIIKHGLSQVTEVWAIEQSLYFPGLYSGTTDLLGIYDGQPAVMDFKQSNRAKLDQWVDDYRLQISAYLMAHNEIYGTDMRRGVIMMCTRNHEYQQFDITPKNFSEWSDKWLIRVEQYYKMINADI